MTDALSACLVAEELAWGCIAIGNLVTSPLFGTAPILALGSEEQQQHWLPRFAGERYLGAALCVTEPEVGSDAASLRTRAERRADGSYVLNGRKRWVSSAGIAELYTVFATVDPARGAKGITVFIVTPDAQGLVLGKKERKMGQRAIPNADVVLSDCAVPEDHRLGAEGEGFSGLMRVFDASRITLAAACLGLHRAALEYATHYARERRQFGRPIAEHQAVAFMLADMATELEAARLLVWSAARKHDSGAPVTKEAAMAKLYASEAAMRATHDAVQVLGGYGYSREYPVEKWMRDAKLEEIEEGTSQIQRLIIARQVLGPKVGR
jgi:acyl-CoA dehydrogenase